MTDLSVYTTLPNFPNFGSIDIPFASTNPYSLGTLNSSVNLSSIDYQIIEGINVARTRLTLERPAFTYYAQLNPSGGLTQIDVPAEVYGSFYAYKTAPYLSTTFLRGYEWILDTASSFIPPVGERLSEWDVYQHYRDANIYEYGQNVDGLQAGVPIIPPVKVRAVPDFNWVIDDGGEFRSSNLISAFFINSSTVSIYDRWHLGDWDWEGWDYWNYGSTAFPPRWDETFVDVYANAAGVYQMRTFVTVVRVQAVNYINLLSGYPDDTRVILNEPIVIPVITETCEIGYYRENKLEPIPGLRTIDWMTYTVELIANTPIKLPIIDCTLGTLHVSSSSFKAEIISAQVAGTDYPTKYYFQDYLEELFLVWNNTLTIPAPVSTFRAMGANNNVWNNRNNPTQDIGFNITHPMFAIDSQRAYDWHIAPQSNNNGIGTLIMDSPRTIEIHTALNASEYLLESPAIIGTGTTQNPQTPALHKLDWYIKNGSISDKITAIWKTLGGDYFTVNRVDANLERITNVGWYIENIARVLGLRRDDNGEIDREAERKKYRPQTVNNPTLGDPSASGKYNGYSLACFGDRGRIMPHLPTAYTANGKGQELYDVYHDIPQQLEMLLRQLDVSLSIQHGSQIRVNGVDGKIHSYPNQLGVHLECLHRLEKIAYNTEKNLLLSTVAGTELRGLYSGIGIPVTNNFLELKNPNGNKQTLYLPYFTHQKNKPSIAQSLTTVHVNLGVINGVLMPKKQPVKNDIYNPFKKFIPAKD